LRPHRYGKGLQGMPEITEVLKHMVLDETIPGLNMEID